MNVPAVIKPKSVLLDMSDRYGMEPAAFEATVRATCMQPDKNGRVPSREEFAAFLLVAKEYDLNPITRQIYAFVSKSGAIVPIVSIDGWLNLVNSHPQCDGFDFEPEYDEKGNLVSYTCTMHRKDRSHPTAVTEYLSECIRPTDPWRMKHRMLRHKSMIQAARYAFGFAGIYDEDEGRTIAEAVDVTPKAPLRVPSPVEIEQEVLLPEHGNGSDKYKPGEEVNLAHGAAQAPKDDPITTGPQPRQWLMPNIENDYDGWFSRAMDIIAHCEDGGELETFWNTEVEKYRGTDSVFPSDLDDLTDAYSRQQTKLNSDE